VRHIPPGSSLSITATLILGLSWIIGSTTFIAEPLPITIRSYCFILPAKGSMKGAYLRWLAPNALSASSTRRDLPPGLSRVQLSLRHGHGKANQTEVIDFSAVRWCR